MISGRCPEDYHEIKEVLCQPDPGQCILDGEDFGQWRHPYSVLPVAATRDQPVKRVKKSAGAPNSTDQDSEFVDEDYVSSSFRFQKKPGISVIHLVPETFFLTSFSYFK
jgi:hypothetical protein